MGLLERRFCLPAPDCVPYSLHEQSQLTNIGPAVWLWLICHASEGHHSSLVQHGDAGMANDRSVLRRVSLPCGQVLIIVVDDRLLQPYRISPNPGMVKRAVKIDRERASAEDFPRPERLPEAQPALSGVNEMEIPDGTSRQPDRLFQGVPDELFFGIEFLLAEVIEGLQAGLTEVEFLFHAVPFGNVPRHSDDAGDLALFVGHQAGCGLGLHDRPILARLLQAVGPGPGGFVSAFERGDARRQVLAEASERFRGQHFVNTLRQDFRRRETAQLFGRRADIEDAPGIGVEQPHHLGDVVRHQPVLLLAAANGLLGLPLFRDVLTDSQNPDRLAMFPGNPNLHRPDPSLLFLAGDSAMEFSPSCMLEKQPILGHVLRGCFLGEQGRIIPAEDVLGLPSQIIGKLAIAGDIRRVPILHEDPLRQVFHKGPVFGLALCEGIDGPPSLDNAAQPFGYRLEQSPFLSQKRYLTMLRPFFPIAHLDLPARCAMNGDGHLYLPGSLLKPLTQIFLTIEADFGKRHLGLFTRTG